MSDKKPKIIKREDREKERELQARAEIATLRGVCALLALKYPDILRDECRKLERKMA